MANSIDICHCLAMDGFYGQSIAFERTMK